MAVVVEAYGAPIAEGAFETFDTRQVLGNSAETECWNVADGDPPSAKDNAASLCRLSCPPAKRAHASLASHAQRVPCRR